jgi:hypothetical protein
MTKQEWLSYKNPSISFLAEKGHRVRGYSKKYFALVSLPKSKNFRVTKLDAEQTRCWTSWTLRIRMDGTFNDFKVPHCCLGVSLS